MANLSNINNKFLVTTGGNVGINTTSPDSKLDVTGGDITVNTTGTGFMNFKYSGSQKGTIGTDGIDLKITANSDLQLLPQGNVGIGTASPGRKLTIGNANGFVNNQISLLDGGGTEQATIAVETTTANDLLVASKANLRFFTGSTIGGTTTLPTNERMRITSAGAIEIKGTSTTSQAQAFITNDNSVLSIGSSVSGSVVKDIQFNSPSPMMYIDGSTARVGIGTTSPDALLDLESATPALRITDTDNNKPYELRVDAETFSIKDVSNSRTLMSMTTGAVITLDSLGSNTVINTSGAMVVPNGKVGIGFTTPSARLDVRLSGTTGRVAEFHNSVGYGIGFTVQSDGGVNTINSESNQALAFATNGASERMRITIGGNVQARRPRSNTAGDVALSLQPTDTTAHYGWRIDQATNSLNLDYVNTPLNLVSYSTTGNATFAGTSNSNVVIARDNMFVVGGQFYIGADNGATDNTFRQAVASGAYKIESRESGTWTQRFMIDTNGAATFSGDVVSNAIAQAKGFRTETGSTDYSILSRNSTNTAVYIQQAGSGNIVDFRYGSQAAGQGTSAMYINSSGDATFAQKINAGGRILTEATTSNALLQVKYNSSNYLEAYYDKLNVVGGNFLFQTGGNTRMVISTAGSVGIGTTSPNQKLEVSGGNINIQNGDGGFITWENGSANITLHHNGTGRDLSFKTYNPDNGNNAERMRLDKNGNLGIGTPSPGAKLEVVEATANTDVILRLKATRDAYLQFAPANTVKWGLIADYPDLGDFTTYNYPNNFNAIICKDNKDITTNLSGGNFGIGTTSPAQKLDVVGKMKISDDIILAQTNGRIDYDNGVSSGALRFHSTSGNAERMRITSAGNVGIGTADGPGDVNAKLHVYKQAGDNTVNELLRLDCGENNHNVGKGGAIVFRDINVYTDTAKIIAQRIGNTGGSTLQFSLRGGEKMRIKSDGNVGIGTTSPTYKLHVASSNNVSIFEDTSNASGAAFIVFNRPGVFSMGSITRNGSANSVSYNTGSDYRLKEDLKDFNALDLVNNITAYDYKWKDIEQRDYGFIAHELKQTLPNVVTGEKDGEKMQGVDYSKLTPILLKAIQELEARVKELENK